MKKMRVKNSFYVALLFVVVTVSSCVPTKIHKQLEDDYRTCQNDLYTYQSKADTLEVKNTILNNELNKATRQLNELKEEVIRLTADKDTLSSKIIAVKSEYAEMLGRYSQQLVGSRSENSQLSVELSKREIELQNKAAEIKAKEDKLNTLVTQIEEKENKIKEFEDLLSKKEAEVSSLKDKISKALLGFENKGLTVHTKDGKVYVSVEEKLLFASGSWTVATEGKSAIKEIALVLEKNPEIDILVEGHTDNVPYRGTTGVRDNWDLSVMRATSIVKILLESAPINPERVMAAGRGEFFPIAQNDTKENKAKNRRTEIILTPKLNEVFELLNK